MLHPIGISGGVFLHVLVHCFRDDVVFQMPFAYTNNDINYNTISSVFCFVFLMQKYQKNSCQNNGFMLIIEFFSTTSKLDKRCTLAFYCQY